MTVSDQHSSVLSWSEPEGLNPRGTVVVVPGRGERPEVYERFGRRISSDAYRVHVVANPVEDAALAEEQIRSLLAGPKPIVLAGSDTGALFAAGLVASRRLPEAEALVLAGLPTAAAQPEADAADERAADSWAAELEARTACPAHRGRLAGPILRRGALYEPVPDGWLDLADLKAATVPVLGLHGAADAVSPLAAAR